MVAFGVTAVDDVDKFCVVVAPVVTLVTAGTSLLLVGRLDLRLPIHRRRHPVLLVPSVERVFASRRLRVVVCGLVHRGAAHRRL